MPNTTHLRIPSNKVDDIVRYIHAELDDSYPAGEINMFVRLLFETFLEWDQVHFMLNRHSTINQSDLLKFHWAIEDLKRNRPIQYICGHTEFCGLDIHVSEGVLIPRPETEEIVLTVANIAAQLEPDTDGLKVLDICTGSGCIALAMSHLLPSAQVYGLDISPQALTIARENAEQLQLHAHFLECDILHDSPALPCSKFDIIISNPPYIQEAERTQMNANVLDYEPDIALFVPNNDPLIFYRAIGQYAATHLSPNGILAFEINEHLGNQTCRLLESMGFACQLHQDFRNKDRSITATLN